MCETCCAVADYYGEPIPGYHLYRATKDGMFMRSGDWGLSRCNDPDYYWSVTPRVDPSGHMTDDQLNSMTQAEGKDSDDWYEQLEMFSKSLRSSPDIGYELYCASQRTGYNPEKNGYLAYWLFNRLGEYLKGIAYKPVDDVKSWEADS